MQRIIKEGINFWADISVVHCEIWYHLLSPHSLMHSCCLVCLLTSKQRNALKRKLQSSPHGNPPLKRKSKPSVNNFKKRAAETGTREKGSSSQRSLPKKQLTTNQNESQKSKLFIKTSSLFKNNPDIPEIHRYLTNFSAWHSVCNSSPCFGKAIAWRLVSLLSTWNAHV